MTLYSRSASTSIRVFSNLTYSHWKTKLKSTSTMLIASWWDPMWPLPLLSPSRPHKASHCLITCLTGITSHCFTLIWLLKVMVSLQWERKLTKTCLTAHIGMPSRYKPISCLGYPSSPTVRVTTQESFSLISSSITRSANCPSMKILKSLTPFPLLVLTLSQISVTSFLSAGTTNQFFKTLLLPLDGSKSRSQRNSST